MSNDVIILIVEAVSVYLLVLWSHSIRHRVGLAPFYALLGGITAVMSWVTDAGVKVEALGITFMVGSTVFYTGLLLGVFVVYVFDGPHSTRIAIFTIAGVSIMVPVIAVVLHAQMRISAHAPLVYIPLPSLRINIASVFATVADLIFLAVAWEFLGRPKLHMRISLRAFFTLLGVMWLDVVLFATGAFAGTPNYLRIMEGTLLSRLVISVFAWPFLYVYLIRQNVRGGAVIENRPVLAILKEMAEVRAELGLAQQEIERRKRAEHELKTAYHRLNQIIEFLPDPTVVIDNQGRVTAWNRAMAELTGVNAEGMIGKGDYEYSLLFYGHRRPVMIDLVVKHDQQAASEYLYLRREGDRLVSEIYLPNFRGCGPTWFWKTAAPLYDEDGCLVGAIEAIRDITIIKQAEGERLEMERRLFQSRKLESLGIMAGGIAHNFNNQLQVVLGNLQLALMKLTPDSPVHNNIQAAFTAGQKSAKLSGQMLAYSGAALFIPRELNLNDLLNKNMDVLRSIVSKTVTLNVQYEDEVETISGDEGYIERVITSLVNNASEAIGNEAGEILVSTGVMECDEAYLSGARFEAQAKPGRFVFLQVTDNGCGMDVRTLEQLFDPFFTTKFVGRGLGMSAVLGIVRAHRGAIMVDSEVEIGTTFRVLFPVSTTVLPKSA